MVGYTIEELQSILIKYNIKQDPVVKIMAYCLRDNHYHFIIQEIIEGGIVKFMQRLGDSYGKFFSIKYDTPGSLFQGRYKSVIVKNNEQLQHLLMYVNIINPAENINPKMKERGVRDVEKTWEYVEGYTFGSHPEYNGQRISPLIDRGILGKLFKDANYYRDFAKDALNGKEFNNIKLLSDTHPVFVT